jgi:hypothetical protein
MSQNYSNERLGHPRRGVKLEFTEKRCPPLDVLPCSRSVLSVLPIQGVHGSIATHAEPVPQNAPPQRNLVDRSIPPEAKPERRASTTSARQEHPAGSLGNAHARKGAMISCGRKNPLSSRAEISMRSPSSIPRERQRARNPTSGSGR